MSDNVKRSLRTLVQALLGLIAAGGLTKVWEDYLNQHHVDSTVTLAVGLLLAAIITWAHNTIEDKTGTGVAVPEDRKLGDASLGTGVGAK